jgi:hypothetical protein
VVAAAAVVTAVVAAAAAAGTTECAALDVRGRCRGVGWGPKKARCKGSPLPRWRMSVEAECER